MHEPTVFPSLPAENKNYLSICSKLCLCIFHLVGGEGQDFGWQQCPTLCDPMDYSPPGSSIHGILQARYWSGLPFPFPGDCPNPGIEPGSPGLQAYSTELWGKPMTNLDSVLKKQRQYFSNKGPSSRSYDFFQ